MSRPHLPSLEQQSLDQDLAAREPAQLTLDGGFVGHREVVREQERLAVEERERILKRKREQAEAQRPAPMDPELLLPLFDVE